MISKELQLGRAGEYLVLADLLLKGKQAFLTEQGASYDIVFEHNSRLIRLQVKSTRGFKILNRGYKNKVYSFHVRRCGKGGKRIYSTKEFDGFAFVTLNDRQVYYEAFNKRVNRSWIFRCKTVKYCFTNQKTAPNIQNSTLERFLNELS